MTCDNCLEKILIHCGTTCPKYQKYEPEERSKLVFLTLSTEMNMQHTNDYSSG